MKADLASFAQEKMQQDLSVGCDLILVFSTVVKQELRASILHAIHSTWEDRPTVKQKVVYSYPNDVPSPVVKSTLTFNRKITEEQLPDIPSVLTYIMRTVEAIRKVLPQ